MSGHMMHFHHFASSPCLLPALTQVHAQMLTMLHGCRCWWWSCIRVKLVYQGLDAVKPGHLLQTQHQQTMAAQGYKQTLKFDTPFSGRHSCRLSCCVRCLLAACWPLPASAAVKSGSVLWCLLLAASKLLQTIHNRAPQQHNHENAPLLADDRACSCAKCMQASIISS